MIMPLIQDIPDQTERHFNSNCAHFIVNTAFKDVQNKFGFVCTNKVVRIHRLVLEEKFEDCESRATSILKLGTGGSR
jgi:hypothetical protein